MEEVEPVTGQSITSENLREFTDAYEEKKQLNTEIKAMDAKSTKRKDSKTTIQSSTQSHRDST